MGKRLRYRLAYLLNRLPFTCWSDLVGWVEFHRVHGPIRPFEGARVCRPGAQTHRDCACYCGKFRREVPDA